MLPIQSNLFTDGERNAIKVILHTMLPEFLDFKLGKAKEKDAKEKEVSVYLCIYAPG